MGSASINRKTKKIKNAQSIEKRPCSRKRESIYLAKKVYLYKRESTWLSQHAQQVPFWTWTHLDPSSDVSAIPAAYWNFFNTGFGIHRRWNKSNTCYLIISTESTIQKSSRLQGSNFQLTKWYWRRSERAIKLEGQTDPVHQLIDSELQRPHVLQSVATPVACPCRPLI